MLELQQQRRQRGHKRSSTSSTCRSVLRFQRLSIERYNHDAQYFFQQEQEKVQTVTMVALKRSSLLVFLLSAICPLAIVDTINLLPICIITYCIGISLAVDELLSVQDIHHYQIQEHHKRISGDLGLWDYYPDTFLWMQQKQRQKQREELQQQQQQEEELQLAIQKAQFEYHILKGQSNIQIIPIYHDDSDGSVSLFAV